jgi:DNA polymerase-3 subunit epsilon
MTDKDRLQKWARDVLADPGIIILDTETTGLGEDAEICELAIINICGDELFNRLIKPMRPIPPKASEIHGITDNMVVDAPTWADVHDEIVRIVTDASRLLIYNEAFDIKLIRQSAFAAGMSDEALDWLLLIHSQCVMDKFAEWHGDWNDYYQTYRWQKLSTAAKSFGVDPSNEHRALTDCRLTLEVIRGMAQ